MAGRLPTLATALMLLFVGLVVMSPARGENVLGTRPVIVAMIDTGVDVRHQEFDYQGASSATDQVVAWWDFTPEHKAAGRTNPFDFGSPTWDLDITDPYDPNGHGTGTASLAVGRDLGSCGATPKWGFAPGAKLAIAKVGEGDGTISGDLATAILWATDVVHADVISMSIGAIAPVPSLGDPATQALQHARDVGVLAVVAAGNGLGNTGLAPTPSEMGSYGSAPSPLVVGGGSRSGGTLTSTTGNSDPDVSSWSDGVCIARAGTTSGYLTESGTSFSTPLVAGMAANATDQRLNGGFSATPDDVETLLKHCALDTVAPFAREGWGFLGDTQFNACVKPNAAAGTIPAYQPFAGTPVNPNQLYDDNVRAPLRQVFGATPVLATTQPAALGVRTPIPALTTPGVLGASLPVGVFEAEGYTVHLNAGERLSAAVHYASGAPLLPSGLPEQVPDFDVALVKASDYDAGVLVGIQRVSTSGQPGLTDEALGYSAGTAGDYVIVVYGFLIPSDTAFTVTANHAVSLRSQGIYLGQNVD